MALSPAVIAPFLWGAGGQRLTPEEIAAQRQIAEALLGKSDTSPVGHWTQGAARLVDALGGVLKERGANKAEKLNQSESQNRIASLLGGLGGGTSQFPAAPGMGGDSSPAPTDYATSRVSQAAGDGDIRTGIIATAESLGIDPLDLATAISYETAGTFDPTKAGPTTQWGQHKGLIQFGEPQAKQYGVDWNNPMGSQLGPDGAVAKYLKDTGVQPGMGLLDIYSAINAGGVGRYDRSDANNGGAPGTVADKVNKQMAGHREKAMALLGMSAPTNAVAANEAMAGASAGIPGQQTMPLGPGAAPQAAPSPVAAALGGGMPEMAGNAPAPVQVAQAGGINPAIIEALSSPYASPQEKQIAQALLGQHLDQQAQASDPMRAMQVEKAQLELEAMRNPPPQALINSGDGRLYDPNTGTWVIAPDTGNAETFRMAAPEEAAKYGAAAGQFGPDGRFYPINPPQGTSLQVDPTTGAVTFNQGAGVKPLTEGQSKDTVFSTRAEGALPIIDQYGDALTNLGESVAGQVPGVGNYMKSPEFQQAEQAGKEFLQAILRKDTGAAITAEETSEYGSVYLPRPGDSPQLLEQKRVSRQRAIAAINAGLPPQAIIAREKALASVSKSGGASGQPVTAVPQGVSPEEWEVMTPEERRLFE